MKSLDGALGLLAHFIGSQPDFGVGELAERSGMPKSQVSKILATFRRHGILGQDPRTRRYHVEALAFALGSRFVNHSPLVGAASPAMRELVSRSGHSARLSIRVGDHVLYLIGIEGPHFIDTGWRCGQWMPMHAASAARALLAFFPEETIAAILDAEGMPPVTPHTVQDRGALLAMLEEVRRTGIARNRDETAVGLSTLSAPVLGASALGPGGEAIAALTLAFPSHVVAPEAEAPLIGMLQEAARTVSYKMGCGVYRYGGLPAEARHG